MTTASRPFELPEVAAGPLIASAMRALDTLAELGEPLPEAARDAISRTAHSLDAAAAVAATLSPWTLADILLDPAGYGRVQRGGARPVLVEHGWRSFLVRVINPLRLENTVHTSHDHGTALVANHGHNTLEMVPQLWDRLDKSRVVELLWLQATIAGDARLSGLEIEYRVVSLYSKRRGPQTTYLGFAATPAPDTALWGRQGIDLDVDCLPSTPVTFGLREPDDRTTVASLVVRDAQGRVYPSRAMRLAPDMGFHDQVYRGDGESILLPDGAYTVAVQRGPESVPLTVPFVVDGEGSRVEATIDYWTRPDQRGYYSGDPHLHAAGCSHYSVPTQGVSPETVVRLIRGEGIWVGSVLTWAPCYYHQKQFFSGRSISPEASLEEPALQQAQGGAWQHRTTDTDHETHLRYDIEVSGFPSSHSGHLILIGLSDQDYPGTARVEDWPSFSLPVLQWGAQQGALVGFAHGGVGLAVDSTDLPNYEMPRFRGIGMNEVIVDVACGAADFVSGCQELPAAELNAWYHMLNSGHQILMTGETDYPCIYDTRPGVGRTYVELTEPPSGERAVEQWIEGLRGGRSYIGDGRSHLYDVTVEAEGARPAGPRALALPTAAPVRVTADVVALLDEVPSEESRILAASAPHAQPAWHLERARIPGTREVAVELVVNGMAADTTTITADGTEHRVEFVVDVAKSAWVALRILPSAHSQPVFIEVDGAPVRPSSRSIQWCLDAIDVLWEEKSPFIRARELPAAAAAYERARTVYRERLAEATGL